MRLKMFGKRHNILVLKSGNLFLIFMYLSVIQFLEQSERRISLQDLQEVVLKHFQHQNSHLCRAPEVLKTGASWRSCEEDWS